MHPFQPAEIVQTGFIQSQQTQTGEIPLHTLLRAPAPEPRLQQSHGIRHQCRINRVTTSLRGALSMSIECLETESEYLLNK